MGKVCKNIQPDLTSQLKSVVWLQFCPWYLREKKVEVDQKSSVTTVIGYLRVTTLSKVV